MTKACPRIFWALLGCMSASGCGGKSGDHGADCPGPGGVGGGGAATAGTATGGAATAGTATGGAATAGTATAGAATGGAATGGAATAGTATGGAAGDLTQQGGNAGATDLGGAGGTSDATCLPPRDGLVGWWPGEGNAEDASGGDSGILQGGVTFGSGQVGQAFSFDGTDDLVNLGNAPQLHVSAADFTVEAWVRFDSHQGDMSIADKMAAGGVNADGWRLLKQADDRFWFCFGGGAQNGCTLDPASTVYSTTSVISDVWFHVVAVKTSTSFALYVNGKLEDNRSPLPAFVDTSSTDLLLGAYAGDGAPAQLDGSIDEAKLFNRALSAQEIALLFATGTSSECHGSAAAENGGAAGAGGRDAGNLACAGEGLVHTVPNECMDDGGYSGIDDALEVYCCGGTSRFCLSGETCPWRAGCTDDVSTCSRGGLATDYLASAWCSEWNGHHDYYCGEDAQIRFVP